MIRSVVVTNDKTCCTYCGNRIPRGMRARKKFWKVKRHWVYLTICPLCIQLGKRFKEEESD